MKNLQLSEFTRNEILTIGILGEKYVQISHKGQSGWQLYKGRLKQGSIADGIELAGLSSIFGKEGTFSGEVGVSFRLGHKKLLFHADGNAPYVEWPNNLAEVQRRAFERQNPIECLSVRMYPPGDKSKVIHGQIQNISTGGIQVSIRDDGEELLDCYCCSINSEPCIVTDALVRSIDPTENKRILVGMQFVGLELDPSLQNITKLIKLVQGCRRRQARKQAPQSLPATWQELYATS